MKTTVQQSLRAAAVLAAGTLGLALALGTLAGGCGDAGTSETEAPQGGSTVTSITTQRPPIDLLAPTTFETASFALG